MANDAQHLMTLFKNYGRLTYRSQWWMQGKTTAKEYYLKEHNIWRFTNMN